VVFAIDAMGARVAMLRLAEDPPRLLLTDHLDGDVPILVFRVASLDAARDELRVRGWEDGRALELPHGPAESFATPGGQRIAIYERTRHEVDDHFAGRRDF
jgi:hypothetical protein